MSHAYRCRPAVADGPLRSSLVTRSDQRCRARRANSIATGPARGEPIGDDRAGRRVLAGAGGAAAEAGAPDFEPRRAASNSCAAGARRGRRQPVQRRDIVENPERAPLGRRDEVVVLEREIGDRDDRQIELQRLPLPRRRRASSTRRFQCRHTADPFARDPRGSSRTKLCAGIPDDDRLPRACRNRWS